MNTLCTSYMYIIDTKHVYRLHILYAYKFSIPITNASNKYDLLNIPKIFTN